MTRKKSKNFFFCIEICHILATQNWCLREKIDHSGGLLGPLCQRGSSGSSGWCDAIEGAILDFLSKNVAWLTKTSFLLFLEIVFREKKSKPIWICWLIHLPCPSDASNIRRETNRMPVVKNVHHFGTKDLRWHSLVADLSNWNNGDQFTILNDEMKQGRRRKSVIPLSDTFSEKAQCPLRIDGSKWPSMSGDWNLAF